MSWQLATGRSLPWLDSPNSRQLVAPVAQRTAVDAVVLSPPARRSPNRLRRIVWPPIPEFAMAATIRPSEHKIFVSSVGHSPETIASFILFPCKSQLPQKVTVNDRLCRKSLLCDMTTSMVNDFWLVLHVAAGALFVSERYVCAGRSILYRLAQD